jgi:hypothetical protein
MVGGNQPHVTTNKYFMSESIKKLFHADESHVLKAKEIARQIFEERSQYHSEMVGIIKETLNQLHTNVTESIKKS